MDEEIIAGLAPMFEQAEKEGLWFYGSYQDMWFSPAELKQAQSEGRFVWGAVNWSLRNPQEKIDEMERRIKGSEVEIERFKLRLG